MKRIILFLLTMYFSIIGYSQSELYSLKLQYSPVEAMFLNSVNAETAQTSELSPSSIASYYNPVGGSAVDPINNYYYVLIMVDMTTQALLTIDLNNGEVINQPIIFNPDEIHQMVYNCVDSTLYAIEVVWEPNQRYLVTVNPKTGETTRVSKAPIFEWYTTHSMTIIDPVKNILYTLGTDKNEIYHFYGVDLSTGAIVSDPIVQNPDDYHQIAFNCMDSSIYAIKVIWEPNERYLMKINPETGVATQLSSKSIFEWYKTEQRTTIDPTVGLMYLIATDKQDKAGMYAVNLESGEVDLNIPINSIDDFHQLRSNCSCFPKGDFEYENVICDSTKFEVTYATGTYKWNFDDPASGKENESTLKEPKHMFTAPGTYSVELVIKGCYSYDTIVKDVVVTNTGSVYLGPDTLICENESLVLSTSVAGGSYVWSDGSTNPSLTVTQSGLYSITVLNKACAMSDTIKVDFIPQPTINLGNDATICSGESLVLDASTPQALYTWQDNSTDPTYTVTQTGTYSVVLGGAGCGATDDIFVRVIDVSVDLGSDITLCEGDVHVLYAFVPNATYVWSNGSTDPNINVVTTGNYSVTVTNEGCTNTDEVFVRFNTPPVLDLGPDISICEGESVELKTSLQGSYLWSTGSTQSSVLVNTSGIYTLQIIDDACLVRDEIEVFTKALPQVDLGIDRNYCLGEVITLNGGVGDSYIWQDGSTAQTLRVNKKGLYSVTTVLANCTARDEVYIGFDSFENAYIPSDTILCTGTSIYLHPFIAEATYLWQDNSTSSQYFIREAGEYSVTIEKGTCSTHKTILVEEEDCNCCLYIPEAFAPQNPAYGVRRFKPVGKNLREYSITIFDKWGNIVWYSNELTPEGAPAEAWDGIYNGIPIEQGVYIWRIKAIFRNGEEWKHNSNKNNNYGNVELIR